MVKAIFAAAALASALFVGACGGSDPSNIQISTYSGIVQQSDGAAANAEVTASKIIGGAVGSGATEVFTPVDANANGNFTYSFLTYVGPVHFSADTTPPMTAAFSEIPARTASSLTLSPFTSVVTTAAASTGAINANSLAEANANVGTDWLNGAIDIYATRPLDPVTNNDPNGASQGEKFYYFLLGAMELLAADLPMIASVSELETKMLEDASDGTFDGMNGVNAIANLPADAFTTQLGDRVTTYANGAGGNVTHDAVALAAFVAAIKGFDGVLAVAP